MTDLLNGMLEKCLGIKFIKISNFFRKNINALILLKQCFDELDSNNLDMAKNKLLRAISSVNDQRKSIKIKKRNGS